MSVFFYDLTNNEHFLNLKPKNEEEFIKKFICFKYKIKEDKFMIDDKYSNSLIVFCTINDNLRISQEDAGIDLTNLEDIKIYKPIENIIDEPFIVKTGCKIKLPIGYSALVLPRSSSPYKFGYTVANSPGLIDASYRGDIGIIINIFNRVLFNKLLSLNDEKELVVKKGTRLAQLFIVSNLYPTSYSYYYDINFVIIKNKYIYENFDKIFPSKRGSGGFGSTGIK